MLKEELLELIEDLKDAQSDTAHVEIKSCAGGFPKRLWETVSAFANTSSGGIIILGVSEEGMEITGVKDPAKYQKDLGSICSQMSPAIRPLIEVHKVRGKVLVTAEIPEVSYKDKPCFYKGSGMISGSLIRVADGDRHLTQYEVQGFLDGRGQPVYDVEPVAGTTLKDLDQDILQLFLNRVREQSSKVNEWDDVRILRTYRVLVDHNGDECVSLGGFLCFGAYPQAHAPNLVTHIMVFPETKEGEMGKYGERLLDSKKVEGSLIQAVPEIMSIIKRNIKQRHVVRGIFREDVLEYPEIFLREAVINALGHRDYSPLARGTAVQIKIFPDRIEIISPGGLFGPVTEERLGELGLQAARNSYLMKLLEDSPVPHENRVLCENRGTGIPSMINTLKNAGMEPPTFEDLRNQFRVVCYNMALFDQETLSWLQQFTHVDLTERQRYALAYIYHHKKLTNAVYSRMCDCDSRLATKELGALAEKDIVKQHGSRRWAYYTLMEYGKQGEKALSGTKTVRRHKDRREEILRIIKERGEAGREDIQKNLPISPAAVLHWIRKLIREGKIEPTTKSIKDPKVKYRLKRR